MVQLKRYFVFVMLMIINNQTYSLVRICPLLEKMYLNNKEFYQYKTENIWHPINKYEKEAYDNYVKQMNKENSIYPTLNKKPASPNKKKKWVNKNPVFRCLQQEGEAPIID